MKKEPSKNADVSYIFDDVGEYLLGDQHQHFLFPELANPLLFLVLANAQPTAEGVCDFLKSLWSLLRRPGEPPDPDSPVGELVGLSTAQISGQVADMRRALGELVAVQSGGLSAFNGDSGAAVCEIVNNHLRSLSPLLGRGFGEFHVVPASADLFDAIWHNFATTIAAGRKFAQCKQCGNFFEISGGAGRSDKIYCSIPCQLKAYRERKRTASELRDQGASIREIAKQLGSTVETVKGWLETSPVADTASTAKAKKRKKRPAKKGK